VKRDIKRLLLRHNLQSKESVMREGVKQHVDTNSVEFKQGVEAGLNSPDDTKNWEAGNKLGQELKDEGEKKAPVYENTFKKSPTPLFMKDTPEGNRENAQDEKDEAAE
jgi:hypothetical protein